MILFVLSMKWWNLGRLTLKTYLLTHNLVPFKLPYSGTVRLLLHSLIQVSKDSLGLGFLQGHMQGSGNRERKVRICNFSESPIWQEIQGRYTFTTARAKLSLP